MCACLSVCVFIGLWTDFENKKNILWLCNVMRFCQNSLSIICGRWIDESRRYVRRLRFFQIFRLIRFMHAWILMINYPKWKSKMETKPNKTSKVTTYLSLFSAFIFHIRYSFSIKIIICIHMPHYVICHDIDLWFLLQNQTIYIYTVYMLLLFGIKGSGNRDDYHSHICISSFGSCLDHDVVFIYWQTVTIIQP